MFNTMPIYIEGQASRVNKETKILSKYDVKIHRVNWLKPAILTPLC